MDEHAKVKHVRLSVYMTGDPARRLRQMAREKGLNMNQVVRKALNIWGRLEEVLTDPDDLLFVRHKDGSEQVVRFPL